MKDLIVRLKTENNLKIINNIGWLFFDKALRMGVGLFVGVWIAKYLRPEGFGMLNYSLAFVALFTPIASLGIEGILIKDIVSKNKPQIYLGTSFFLRIVGSCLAFILSLSIFFIKADATIINLTLIIAFGTFFQSFDIVEYYFQSQLKAKFVVIARNISFVVCSFIKIYFLIYKFPLSAFAIIYSVEILLSSILLVVFYQFYVAIDLRISKWTLNLDYGKELLKQSLPLFFSGFLIIVYMKIDQIMLGEMIDNVAVGEYSAAIRLSEIWYLIPGIIVNSIYPSIVKFKNDNEIIYNKNFKMLFEILIFIGISLALVVTFISGFIVNLLYGKEYFSSGDVLAVHIWTGVFVFLGTASVNWFISENYSRYFLYNSIAGAIMNIACNFLLIPILGIIGAAWATLISQFFSSYLINAFRKNTMPLFLLQSEAFKNIITFKFLTRVF